MEELLELGPDLGRGLSLGRDSRGIFVAEAPKSLRLRPGDRVLGARLSFEGASPEAVRRLLEGAGGCRVSLLLRRRSPGTTPGTTPATTGTTPRATPGTPEGQRDPAARLPTPPPSGPAKPPAAAGPLSVELALPKLPKLPKPLGAPEPPRPRLTVREAAAAAAASFSSPSRSPPPEPPEPPRAPSEPPSSPRIPAVELAAPKASLGLSPAQMRPPSTAGDEEGAAGARGAFPTLRVPSVPIHVPKTAVELGISSPEPPGPERGSRFSEGLRKLSRELEEAPAVEIAPKPPKFRLPRLGWALAKLREGAGTATPAAPPPPGLALPGVELDLGAVGELKVPKLSLVPFGDLQGGPRSSPGASPRSPRPRFAIGAAALPKFGGSSPDLRSGGLPKTPPKRGGSAESLILGWTAPEPAGTPRSGPKSRGVSAARIPSVGLALPGAAPERPEARRAPEPPLLKVPALELAPPRLEDPSEPLGGRRFGVKLPKFGAGSSSGRMRVRKGEEGGGAPRVGNPRRRRWVPRVGFSPGGASPEPPKVGRMRFPDVELCPGDPQSAGVSSRCLPSQGNPKFQLPQLVLSPQICGEP